LDMIISTINVHFIGTIIFHQMKKYLMKL